MSDSASAEGKQRGLVPWKPGQSGNPAGRQKGSRNKLAEVFLAEYPKMVREIRAAIDTGAHAELRRTAHTLKGSAALFLAEPTVAAALRLERMGEEGSLAGAESAFSALETETARLAEALESAISVRAPGSKPAESV